jgi:hypothetical protein
VPSLLHPAARGRIGGPAPGLVILPRSTGHCRARLQIVTSLRDLGTEDYSQSPRPIAPNGSKDAFPQPVDDPKQWKIEED